MNAIDMILQSIQTLIAYFAFETLKCQNLPLGMFMFHMHVGNKYVSSFSQKIGMHKCKVHMQNYLNYQNLPLGIIQI